MGNSNKFIVNLGKSGNRRQRVGIAHKMGLLRKFSTIYGSNEIKARALNSHHGYAALVRNVQIVLYEESRKEAFSRTKHVHLNWDGGSYHGLDVNLGIATDVQHGFCTYLTPSVRFVKRNLIFFFPRPPSW